MALLANAQHQRRTFPGDDQAVRFFLPHHRQGIGALQVGHRTAHCGKQISGGGIGKGITPGQTRLHQVSDGLGIGIRSEGIAQGLQLLLELGVVLDDAVMHHHQAPRRRGGGRYAPPARRGWPSGCGRCPHGPPRPAPPRGSTAPTPAPWPGPAPGHRHRPAGPAPPSRSRGTPGSSGPR